MLNYFILMLGLLLAFLSSFFWATNDLFTKKLIHKGLSEGFVLWVRFPVSALLLFPVGVMYWDLNSFVLLTTFVWLPFEILGSLFFVRALKYAPLSVAMSFYSLMPFFAVIFGFFLLGEGINLLGFLGICLIVLGTLLLTGSSPREFFRKNKGVLYMLLSTMFFGFNVIVGKMVIINSNPFFFSFYYSLCMSFGTLLFTKPAQITNLRSYKEKSLLLLGVFFTLGEILYNLALLYAPASYVASIERLSLLLVMIYGKVFFQEEVKGILPGALLMLLGSILLSLSLEV